VGVSILLRADISCFLEAKKDESNKINR